MLFSFSLVSLLQRVRRVSYGLMYLLSRSQPRSLPPPPPSTCHDPDDDIDSDAAKDETKRIIQDFLNALDFQSSGTPQNAELRQKVQTEIEAWNIDVSTTFTDKMLSNSCGMAECSYPFCPFEIQYFIALYTAFTFYADDHCGDDPEPIGQFALRFSRGQKQLDPVLDRFAVHLKNAFDLFPLAGANVIVSGTFDSMNGMYLEYTTKDMTIRPQATRYPNYLRSRAGACVPYAQLSFPAAWRDRVNSYLQIIPEMDYFIAGANDILSFYKESLAGETDNYVHLRAAAEEKSPIQVLHELSNEVLDTVRRITDVVSPDPELTGICRQFIHGYVEFHVKSPRYRLGELGFRP